MSMMDGYCGRLEGARREEIIPEAGILWEGCRGGVEGTAGSAIFASSLGLCCGVGTGVIGLLCLFLGTFVVYVGCTSIIYTIIDYSTHPYPIDYTYSSDTLP